LIQRRRTKYKRKVPVGILTVFVLLAFAANTLLCRIALGRELIDPVSFTTLRLLSAAIVLVPMARLAAGSRPAPARAGSWLSALALFAYAIPFSLAYLSLDTGMGALILFGFVQATMIGFGLLSGERPRPLEWLGLATALGGLVYLVSPGLTAPDPLGALLMSTAGIAWGVYSLRGRSVTAPVASTAGNFARTVPMAAIASALALSFVHAEPTGIVLALVSGTLTSGLGYVLWYRVLRGLTSTRAAIVQLPVPVIAALGGVVCLAEQLSLRLVVASALILGGVAMAVLTHSTRLDTISDGAVPGKEELG
jgi:drug/metabolite transporter (DMT)-like permease